MPGNTGRVRSFATIALTISILMIVLGSRHTIGLLVGPIVSATAMNIAEVSMAVAVGQLFWGLFQPVSGALADKLGAFPVIVAGMLCLAAGQAGTIFSKSPVPLVISLGILAPVGSSAGSMPVLMGSIASRLKEEKRSVITGIINTGGAVGQFVFAPLVQFFITLRGYTGALGFLGGAALFAIIPAWFLGRNLAGGNRVAEGKEEKPPKPARGELKKQIGTAFREPSYFMLLGEFFTCGFHVTLFGTHFPGEISFHGLSAMVAALCFSIIGICNVAGSIGSGILGKYIRMKYLLSGIYAVRCLLVILYLIAPKTEMTFYVFAVVIGLTWTATVPPTIGLVGKLFGVRFLATLFGLVSLSHQVGAFFGAWLGGLVIQKTGSLLPIWCIAAGLALFASLIVLAIREEKTSASATGSSPA
jgi:predicted MFS family arabinose efflux permease